MAMRITVATSAAEMEPLGPLWRELCSQTTDKTIFQSYEWNLLAARIFSAREQPAIVAAVSDSGAAIIPACTTSNGLKIIGEELFDYPAMLHTGDSSAAIRAWEKLASLGLR